MGGGEGMGPVKKTAKALGESLYDKEAEKPIGQLVIICGRNKNLVSTLESLEWKIPVKVSWFLVFVQHADEHNGVQLIETFSCFYRLEDLRPRWPNGWEPVTAS